MQQFLLILDAIKIKVDNNIEEISSLEFVSETEHENFVCL